MSDFQVREKQITDRRNSSMKEGFDRFMNNNSIRLLISMIPPSDKPDIIETLLKEAFNSGYISGEGNMLGEFLTQMMRGSPK